MSNLSIIAAWMADEDDDYTRDVLSSLLTRPTLAAVEARRDKERRDVAQGIVRSDYCYATLASLSRKLTKQV